MARQANLREAAPRIRLFRSKALITLLTLVMTVSGATAVVAGEGTPLGIQALAAPDEYSIWPDTATPDSASDPDGNPVELGVKFTSTTDGWVTGVRYFRVAGSQLATKGTLWGADGTVLARAFFGSGSSSGWQTASLGSSVKITAGSTYVASYTLPQGGYADDQNSLGGGRTVQRYALTASAGLYSYAQGFPVDSWRSSNYYADVVFTATSPTSSTSSASGSSTTTTPSASGSTTTTTPSASRPVTTATSPTPVKGCAYAPSSCGYPDATNTGVKPGVSLAEVPSQVSSGPGWHWDTRGWIVVDGADAVLENIQTTSGMDVTGSNVTIRNVKITASGESWAIGLKHTKNVTIQDVDIASTPGQSRLIVGIKDVYGDATGTQVLRTDISGISTGIQTHEGLIQDNYIHDFGYLPGDHTNGTTSNGSTVPLTIRHNTIFNQFDQADAISLFQDFGLEANRLIDNNLVAGGSYSIYAGQNRGAATVYNIKVTNNRVARIYFSTGGTFGPVAAYNEDAPDAQFTGNVWDDTNATIPTPGGY